MIEYLSEFYLDGAIDFLFSIKLHDDMLRYSTLSKAFHLCRVFISFMDFQNRLYNPDGSMVKSTSMCNGDNSLLMMHKINK